LYKLFTHLLDYKSTFIWVDGLH